MIDPTPAAQKPRRRSWLLAAASKASEIEQALQSGADVVVLDLVELVAEKDKSTARENVQAAIARAQGSAAEIFVQTDPASAAADLRASVWRGLAGVVIARAESARQIEDAAGLLTELEKERGLSPDTLHIVVALETARGNQDGIDIVRASPRVRGVTLGRADLIMDLRPEPSSEIHLMPYLMQRLIIIAGTAAVTPIGAWWRAPDRGLLATPDNTYQAGCRGRAIGFKGAMCLRANQVDALNRAYD